MFHHFPHHLAFTTQNYIYHLMKAASKVSDGHLFDELERKTQTQPVPMPHQCLE